ncbi:MAG TPA: sulfite exporter TauE/SafE family protein [Longilinea sp.]|nr:sulfite exporter TauE/SafE family protein [Longilinea sp.]
MLTPLDYGLLVLASIAAGFVNALAGGGTLITFPMLNAVGVSAVVSNVTNTVALCPGYFGATLAQANDLRDQKQRLWLFLPIAAVGGIIGGILLLHTGEKLFTNLVPYLILLASGLLALQDPMRRWITHRAEQTQTKPSHLWEALPMGLATIYGGYFGAGMSVIVLAVLGLVVDDSLTHLNALKQAIALSTNVAAAIFFIFSGNVLWSAALIMAVGALIGGALGGRLAGRIKPAALRWIVVTIGVVVSIIYFVK